MLPPAPPAALPPPAPPSLLAFLQPAPASVAASAVEIETAETIELDSLIECLQRPPMGGDRDGLTLWRWRPGINSCTTRSRDRRAESACCKENATGNEVTRSEEQSARAALGTGQRVDRPLERLAVG